MKNIAIVTNQMVMGGIEKSLIELINKLLTSDCKITLFLSKSGGDLYNQIPKNVEIKQLFENNQTYYQIFNYNRKNKGLLKGIQCLFKAIINRFDKNTFRIWKRSLNYSIINHGYYDIAIAYGSPVSLSATCVAAMKNADLKYIWIHNEIDRLGFEIHDLHHYYDEFNKIFCVSKKCREIFLEKLPEYKERTFVFYNIINKNEILDLANIGQSYNDSYNGIRLLTVGRICDQKGQDIIPYVIKKLIESNVRVKWYCIGEGKEFTKKVINIANELGVSEYLSFLGNKDNPYPYFKDCDIYIQPSRHEGFGITISEAKIFAKPIVLTNFAGSDEQIDNGINGIITLFDVDQLYEQILSLILNNDIRFKLGKAALESTEFFESDMEMIIGEGKA